MKAISTTEVTTIDEPDHLEIVVVREWGWIERYLVPAALPLVAIWAFIARQYFPCCFSLIALWLIFARLTKSPVTKLFVYQDRLTNRGSPDSTFTEEVTVEAADVKSLGYYNDSESGRSGLFADRGWWQTCLLRGIDERQANAIADSIRRKFPDFEHGDRSSRTLLYGDSSGQQSLGLSSTDDSSSFASKL